MFYFDWILTKSRKYSWTQYTHTWEDILQFLSNIWVAFSIGPPKSKTKGYSRACFDDLRFLSNTLENLSMHIERAQCHPRLIFLLFGWTKEKHPGEENAFKQCNVYVAICNFFLISQFSKMTCLSVKTVKRSVQIHKRCHQNSTFFKILNLNKSFVAKVVIMHIEA